MSFNKNKSVKKLKDWLIAFFSALINDKISENSDDIKLVEKNFFNFALNYNLISQNYIKNDFTHLPKADGYKVDDPDKYPFKNKSQRLGFLMHYNDVYQIMEKIIEGKFYIPILPNDCAILLHECRIIRAFYRRDIDLIGKKNKDGTVNVEYKDINKKNIVDKYFKRFEKERAQAEKVRKNLIEAYNLDVDDENDEEDEIF